MAKYKFEGGPYDGREYDTNGNEDYFLPAIEENGQLYAIDDPALDEVFSMGPDKQAKYRLLEGRYLYLPE